MSLTAKQEVQLRLLSDGKVYRRAIAFVQEIQEKGTIENKQMSGLLEFSRSWKELQQFVNHQEERDWGKNAHYKDFYGKLKEEIKNLRSFIPNGLTEEQSKQFTGLLARDFIQHLVAEMMWKEKKLP